MMTWTIRTLAILAISFGLVSLAHAERFTFKKGATSQTIYVSLWDSSSSVGGKLTGVVYNAAGLTCYYTRVAGTPTAITLATQTVTGAYSAGGWVQVDATNAPGRYRLDVPDAVFATGVDRASIDCRGAANMVPASIDIQLVAYDPQSATNLGLSYLGGDAFARLGAPAGSSIAQDIALSKTLSSVTVGTGSTLGVIQLTNTITSAEQYVESLFWCPASNGIVTRRIRSVEVTASNKLHLSGLFGTAPSNGETCYVLP